MCLQFSLPRTFLHAPVVGKAVTGVEIGQAGRRGRNGIGERCGGGIVRIVGARGYGLGRLPDMVAMRL